MKKKTTSRVPPKGYRHKVWEGDDMRSGATKVRPPLFGYEDNVLDKTGGPKMGMDLLDLDSAINRIKAEVIPALDTVVKGWINKLQTETIPALKTAGSEAGIEIANRILGGLDDQREGLAGWLGGLSLQMAPRRPTVTKSQIDAVVRPLNAAMATYREGIRRKLYKAHAYEARNRLIDRCAVCGFRRGEHRNIGERP